MPNTLKERKFHCDSGDVCKNPLMFARTSQMVIFAPSNRVMVKAFMKNLPPKKSSF